MITARRVVTPAIDDTARRVWQMAAEVREGFWAQPNTCASHTPRRPAGHAAVTSGRRHSWVSTISAGLPPERRECACFYNGDIIQR